MQEFRLTLTGEQPLLMHNGRLSDPLDPVSKALARLTSKRKKTEDDHIAIAEQEFLGALYLDDVVGPYVPGIMVGAALWRGAKLNKLGEAVKRGMAIKTEVNPLHYPGPRDPAELWRNGSFSHRASVKVGTQRVMRTRPIFREWKIEVDGVAEESQLDIDAIRQIATNTGSFIGIGTWRERFGRFSAHVEEL